MRVNRIIKIGLATLAAVVALLIVAVVLLAVFFDANHYRGALVSQLEQRTGRTVTLGEIHLSFFPTLGLRLRDATLGNPAGFGKAPMARVGEADIGVRLVPLLFENRLAVEAVYLSKVEVDLKRNADGQTNWAGLFKRHAAAADASAPEGGTKGGSGTTVQTVEIDSINIVDGSLHYTDARDHRAFKLNVTSFRTGALTSNKPSSFHATFETSSKAPAFDAKLKMGGRVTFAVGTQHYAIQNLLVHVEASGPAIPGGMQDLQLTGNIAYDGRSDRVRLAGMQVDVAGVRARLSGEATGLRGKHFSFVGPLHVDAFNPRKVLTALGMTKYHPRSAEVLTTASLSAQLRAGGGALALQDLKLKFDATTVRGSLALTALARPAASFDLKADQLDVDHYLPAPPAARPGSAAAREVATGTTPPGQLPFSLLDKLDAQGVLGVRKLTVHGAHLADVTVRLSVHPHRPKKMALDARLYGGGVESHATVTPAKLPELTVKLVFNKVDVGALLHDAADRDILSGKGNIRIDLAATGNTVAALRRSLDGHVSLSLTDGALKGFDLGRILRQAQTLTDGHGQVQAALATPTKKTDFTSVSASGRIANGILTSNDLHGASPLLRLAGVGSANLVDNTIDYTLKPTLVNTATGQGGKRLSQLRGITVPVHLSGPFSHIRYQPDLNAALQQAAQQELSRQLQRHGLDKSDKLQKLQERLDKQLKKGLKRLLGGH